MPLTKQKLNKALLSKYSLSIPRYTSYPTAPEWSESFLKEEFLKANEEGNKQNAPLSLYFHLPFCESRCYFCGCNVVISKKKEITKDYLKHLKKEVNKVRKLVNKERMVEQIHLGGGTPTFFSAEELCELFKIIRDHFNISKHCEISIEVDPRVTTYEQLEVLSSLGFNRISMGIQDFEEKVQEAINRVQSFDETLEIFNYAKDFGFQSINIDLIYGLPYQTKNSFSKTIDLVLELEPDRIALFHYAHLPGLLPHQTKYIADDTLPSSDEKINIFQYAVESFTDNGFTFIGLDHFARPNDELSIAKGNKTLHRNFQGYTTKAGCDLYGFGITAISNVQNTYSQNIKKINPYYEAVDKEEIPLFRGITLNRDDLLRKEIIMKILCHGEVDLTGLEEKFAPEIEHLKEFEKDGLILHSQLSTHSSKIIVTDVGQFFLRNIASVFDYYLHNKNGKQKIYSRTI